jgi:hypothetical protein
MATTRRDTPRHLRAASSVVHHLSASIAVTDSPPYQQQQHDDSLGCVPFIQSLLHAPGAWGPASEAGIEQRKACQCQCQCRRSTKATTVVVLWMLLLLLVAGVVLHKESLLSPLTSPPLRCSPFPWPWGPCSAGLGRAPGFVSNAQQQRESGWAQAAIRPSVGSDKANRQIRSTAQRQQQHGHQRGRRG